MSFTTEGLTQRKIRTKFLNVVSLGCFILATHQSSRYRESQNYLLINTIAEALETQDYTNVAYDITDIFAQTADMHPYDLIVKNFGAASELPEEVKESIIYLLLIFTYLSLSHENDNTMGLIGDFCRELKFDHNKVIDMIDHAQQASSHYSVMAYAREFKESFKIIDDLISRVKANTIYSDLDKLKNECL